MLYGQSVNKGQEYNRDKCFDGAEIPRVSQIADTMCFLLTVFKIVTYRVAQ